LRAAPALAPFLAWVADKDPDFHAVTRRTLDDDDERWRRGRRHG